jgi:predicted alpha/beta superfamily hydrolase
VKKFTSSIINRQEYVLQISLPSGYANGNKKYPVVFLMDSQWDFPLLTALYGEQYFDGFIPEVIIVGITWGGDHPNPDSLRARDYTPTPQKQIPQGGGASSFLSFMQKELFPFIESHYKADSNNRTLMGCSLGGLFTLYALFTQPHLFQRYVAASPAIGWDNQVIYQYEKAYAERAVRPGAKLYICQGGVERGVPNFEKFVQHLLSRNYTSLKLKSEVLENIGHSGTKGEGFEHGLQYAFERTAITLAAAQLKKISGRYKSGDGQEIEIKEEGNNLSLYLSSNNKYKLYAAGKTELYSTAEFLNLHIKVDDNENSTGLILEQYGSSRFFSKMK